MNHIDLHAVELIAEITKVDGKTALMAWQALQPIIGHIVRESINEAIELR